MSDQLMGGPKSIAGTDSLAQTGTVKALTPGVGGDAGVVGKANVVGNAEPSSGNSLPPVGGEDSPDLEALARDLRAVSLSIGRDLKFIVDLESSRPIIQVIDSETGEVVRQIPTDVVSSYSLSDGVEAVHLLDLLA
jgi:flagellar protein FlaG